MANEESKDRERLDILERLTAQYGSQTDKYIFLKYKELESLRRNLDLLESEGEKFSGIQKQLFDRITAQVKADINNREQSLKSAESTNKIWARLSLEWASVGKIWESALDSITRHIPVFGGLIGSILKFGSAASIVSGAVVLSITQLVEAAERARKSRIALGELYQLSGIGGLPDISRLSERLRGELGIPYEETFRTAAELRKRMPILAEDLVDVTEKVLLYGKAAPELGQKGVENFYELMVNKLGKPAEQVGDIFEELRVRALSMEDTTGLTVGMYIDATMKITERLRYFATSTKEAQAIVELFGKDMKSAKVSVEDLAKMFMPTAIPEGIRALIAEEVGFGGLTPLGKIAAPAYLGAFKPSELVSLYTKGLESREFILTLLEAQKQGGAFNFTQKQWDLLKRIAGAFPGEESVLWKTWWVGKGIFPNIIPSEETAGLRVVSRIEEERKAGKSFVDILQDLKKVGLDTESLLEQGRARWQDQIGYLQRIDKTLDLWFNAWGRAAGMKFLPLEARKDVLRETVRTLQEEPSYFRRMTGLGYTDEWRTLRNEAGLSLFDIQKLVLGYEVWTPQYGTLGTTRAGTATNISITISPDKNNWIEETIQKVREALIKEQYYRKM